MFLIASTPARARSGRLEDLNRWNGRTVESGRLITIRVCWNSQLCHGIPEVSILPYVPIQGTVATSRSQAVVFYRWETAQAGGPKPPGLRALGYASRIPRRIAMTTACVRSLAWSFPTRFLM